MNQKFGFMLGSVAAFHLAVGGLLLVSGCAQEDPPMPPGIYVPKHGNALPGRQGESIPVEKPSATEKPAVPESTLDPQSQTAADPAQSGNKAPEKVKNQEKPAPADVPAAKTGDPAAKKDAAAKDRKAGEGTAYKVVKGDSLWKLSRKFKVTLEDLAVFNGLAANAKLYVGQTLMIPAEGQTVKEASPKAKKFVHSGKKTSKKAVSKKAVKGKKSAAKSTKSVKRAAMPLPADGIYTVKSGDNFTVIARRFGLRVADIQNANPGINSSRLKIGQKLQLPAAGSVSNANIAKLNAEDNKLSASKVTDGAVKDEQAEKNPDTANMEKLLDAAKSPAESAKETGGVPEKAASAASPAAADGAMIREDKNKSVKLDDGTDAIRLGMDMTLNEFCKLYKVQRDEVIRLNPTLPFDENLKSGLLVKMP